MRPTGKACSKCVRDITPCSGHLENSYDHYSLKTRGRLPQELRPEELRELEQDLIEYALNRMLALDRDNGNKAEGLPASRLYKSRNESTARALSNLCGQLGPRGFRCIRQPHPQEPDRHKF